MGAVPVPARFGGGFLFWNADTLYRARSFLSELEPVASIETNAIGVEFGHDFVLVLTEREPPRAFNLERHQQVPLSPRGVTTIAGAEDQRVLALDAAGRALSSLDGGKSWKDVGATLGASVQGVHEDASGVAFVLDEKTGIALEPDGKFLRRPFVEASAPPTELPPDVLLTRAVTAGSKVSESSALLGDGNGTRVIELRTGRISARKPAAPAGFNSASFTSARRNARLLQLRHESEDHRGFTRGQRSSAARKDVHRYPEARVWRRFPRHPGRLRGNAPGRRGLRSPELWQVARIEGSG
jgi:hypothetical protein